MSRVENPKVGRPRSRGVGDRGGATATRRIDRLVRIVDCCTEAKAIADATGEKLLAYLLAMSIQECRTAMRGEVETLATTDELPGASPRSARATRKAP